MINKLWVEIFNLIVPRKYYYLKLLLHQITRRVLIFQWNPLHGIICSYNFIQCYSLYVTLHRYEIIKTLFAVLILLLNINANLKKNEFCFNIETA